MRIYCALIIMLFSLNAQADEEVVWAIANWPPYFIRDGEFINQGAGDLFTDYFIDHLGGFKHKKVHMTWTRADKEAKRGNTICMTNRFLTQERKQYLNFTKPYSVSLSLKIVMLKETHQKLGQPKVLSIKKINETYQLSGLLTSNRSFGSTLDAVLEKYRHQPQLKRVQASSSQLLNMLQLNRMDYFIEYPLNVNYLIQAGGFDPEQFVSVDIGESAAYVSSWISCSKTELSVRVVEQLNKTIDREKMNPVYWKRVSHWLSENDALKLRDYYLNHFLVENQ